MNTSLTEKYNKEIIPKMKEKFGYKNNLAVPFLKKAVINVGLGRMSQQPNFVDKILPEIIKDLSAITGQKPKTTAAKKSIAGFKLREGQIVGLKVTLRRKKLNDFLERLINIVLPRVKDFKGIDLKNIDKNGNLSVGLKEHVVFPEINSDLLRFDFGLEISIVSNAKNKEEAIELYKLLGIPFKK
ncbi:50S ribosomal protein L5 [Candidatus Wolfebacteria bacterium]|nr:50S ribosomal protein L5 [Candidatus Wolfebacteria bacterium]